MTDQIISESPTQSPELGAPRIGAFSNMTFSRNLAADLDNWFTDRMWWEEELEYQWANLEVMPDGRSINEFANTHEALLVRLPGLINRALEETGQEPGSKVDINGQTYHVRQLGLLWGLALQQGEAEDGIEFSFATARNYTAGSIEDPLFGLETDVALVSAWDGLVKNLEIDINQSEVPVPVSTYETDLLGDAFDRNYDNPWFEKVFKTEHDPKHTRIFEKAVELVEVADDAFGIKGEHLLGCGQRYLAVGENGLELLQYGEMKPDEQFGSLGGYATTISLVIDQLPHAIALNVGLSRLPQTGVDNVERPVVWRFGLWGGVLTSELFSELPQHGLPTRTQFRHEASPLQNENIEQVLTMLSETDLLSYDIVQKIVVRNAHIAAAVGLKGRSLETHETSLRQGRDRILGGAWTVNPLDMLAH